MSAYVVGYALLFAGLGVAFYFVFASFVFGAGYQPTPRRVVARMLELAGVGSSDLVYDLGAGTGAIVLAAAKGLGARVVGVEVEPVRVLILRWRVRWNRIEDRVTIRWGNLFGLPFRPATVVAVFLWPGAMGRLGPRFRSELAPGSRIVSYYHPIPGWTPDGVDHDLRIFLYRIPETGPASP